MLTPESLQPPHRWRLFSATREIAGRNAHVLTWFRPGSLLPGGY